MPSRDFAGVGPCIPESVAVGHQELESSEIWEYKKEYVLPTETRGQEGNGFPVIRRELR